VYLLELEDKLEDLYLKASEMETIYTSLQNNEMQN